jgi:hypothetical protein
VFVLTLTGHARGVETIHRLQYIKTLAVKVTILYFYVFVTMKLCRRWHAAAADDVYGKTNSLVRW